MLKYDLLVYLGLVPAVAAIFLAGAVMILIPADTDIEVRKMRLAGGAMVAFFSLFVFVTILYFADPDGPGKEIFEKAYTAILTLTGAVVGYVFGMARK
jgi:cytochrome bd-type quinol oxidase subunit 2